MNENTKNIVALADGKRSSKEIANNVGLTPRYVRKVMARYGLPMLPRGAQKGCNNHGWAGGRSIDLDGYVLVPAPEHHPHARQIGVILEHRLVMEKALERYLLPTEVVDHIDGLTIHNAPENLRLFASNAEHLRATISGTSPNWSAEGRANIGTRSDLGKEYQPVDNYRRNKASGDVRLRQILLAWLQLDKDSPYLLGTSQWLEKVGIDPTCRTSLERGLQGLYRG